MADWSRSNPMHLFRAVEILSVAMLSMGGTAWAQGVTPFSSPQAQQGGADWGQAIGVTSIVFGRERPSPDAVPEIVLFTGLLKITKSPVKTLADGRRQLDLVFDSIMPNQIAAVRSAITTLGYVKVAVAPDEILKSTGTLTEIPFASHPKELGDAKVPQALHLDQGHESGHGQAELYLVFEPGQNWSGPPFRQLRNTEPVILSGHIHHIPPAAGVIVLKKGMTAVEMRDIVSALPYSDKWVGANKEPVALRDENGVPQAWFTANVHVTTLTGTCGDGVDNDGDGKIDEEEPNNIDDDGDGFVDEDAKCPAGVVPPR